MMDLHLFVTIKAAQSEKGLREMDYEKYRSIPADSRQYCSRRLRRTRKALSWTHGAKGKPFQKRVLQPDVVSSVRHLELPLFDAERNWAYAMQLKSEAEHEIRKHHHAKTKMERAAFHARALEALTSALSSVSFQTKIEAKAYLSLMEGHYGFQQKDWSSALAAYQRAKYPTLNCRTLLEKFRSICATPEEAALCLQRIEEIEPAITFCAYHASSPAQSTQVEEEETEFWRTFEDIKKAKEAEVTESQTHSFAWAGQTMTVPDSKAMQLQAKLKSMASCSKRQKVAESIVQHYETQLKRAIEKNMNESVATNLRLLQVHSLVCLVKCQLLAACASEGKSPAKRSFLYDCPSKTISRALFISKEGALSNLFQSQFSLFAQICSNYIECAKFAEISMTFVYQQKLSDAAKALKFAEEKLASFSKIADPKILEKFWDVQLQLTDLEKSILLAKTSLIAASSADRLADVKPLKDNLEHFYRTPGEAKIVADPPNPIPLATKPVFFDLAFGELEFPPLEEEKKGITGFLSTLWKK